VRATTSGTGKKVPTHGADMWAKTLRER
jgi:hypothetical protein